MPLEERRYKNLDQPFSSDRSAQGQACLQISKTHDVHIETTLARDQSLTVVLTGKADAVMKAKRDVISKLQTQVCQADCLVVSMFGCIIRAVYCAARLTPP